MFRVSIAGILWLVILASLNFAVLRYFGHIAEALQPIALLVGLMPLFDAFLISFFVVATRRYRFALMRREGRGGFTGAFALAAAVMLAVSTFLCFAATQLLLELVEALFTPFSKWFESLAPFDHAASFLAGVLLCALMSGPLLVVAVVFAFVMSRFRLVITRRTDSD